MKTVEIQGGLGNQLFQIFTLISYSLDNNDQFYFDDRDVERNGKNTTYFNTILHELQKYRKKDTINYIYKERSFSYERIPSLRDVKLFGYFQSYKYFEHNMKKILDFLEIESLKKKYEEKYDYNKTISLHFRIGDYKEIQTHHPVLSIDYYIESLEKLIKDTEKDNWQILYFYEKNDEDMIQKNIKVLRERFVRLSFFPINHHLDDWEQVLCMSLCKHNVIANSSFSWWGAYLNTSDNKVYYPGKWFGPAMIKEDPSKKECKDLIPEGWNKIVLNISLSGYYINLKHRGDREEHMKKNILNKDFFKRINRFEAIKNDNGSLGCALSHINILARLKEKEEPYFLILEDDLEIIDEGGMNSFTKDLDDFFLSGTEWDIINVTPYVTKVKSDFIPIHNFVKTEWTQTTSAYVINRYSIQKLIDVWLQSVEAFQNSTDMEKTIKEYSIDQKWNELENIYVYNSNFARQLLDYSDIDKVDMRDKIQASIRSISHKIVYV